MYLMFTAQWWNCLPVSFAVMLFNFCLQNKESLDQGSLQYSSRLILFCFRSHLIIFFMAIPSMRLDSFGLLLIQAHHMLENKRLLKNADFCSSFTTTVLDGNPRSHHKEATGRVWTDNQQYPVLCHCKLRQDIPLLSSIPESHIHLTVDQNSAVVKFVHFDSGYSSDVRVDK